MCSRTDPLSRLSEIKGRPPIRASLSVDIDECLSQNTGGSSQNTGGSSQNTGGSSQNTCDSSQNTGGCFFTENNNFVKGMPDQLDDGSSGEPLGEPRGKSLGFSPRHSRDSPSIYHSKRFRNVGASDGSSKGAESDDEEEDDEEIDSDSDVDVERISESSQNSFTISPANKFKNRVPNSIYPSLDEFREGRKSPRRSAARGDDSIDPSVGQKRSPTKGNTTKTTPVHGCQSGKKPVIGYNGEPTFRSTSNAHDSDSKCASVLFYIGIFGMLLSVIYTLIPREEPIPKGDLVRAMESLKESFPSQSRRSWNFFVAPLRRVLRDKAQSEGEQRGQLQILVGC